MISVNPVTKAIVELLTAVKNDPECRQVELRYNSLSEFQLCVLWGEWLMKRFEDRGLKVTISP